MYYMKSYIFDSSTLILLAKITILRIFAKENKVIISSKVKSESINKKELEDTKIISHLIEEKIIEEYQEKVSSIKLMNDFKIGEGEAEALQISLKENKNVASDDWRAIKACKILDIKFITAVHCLIHLVKNKKLDKNVAIEKLKKLEVYGRYNPDIIKDAKQIIEGEKHG